MKLDDFKQHPFVCIFGWTVIGLMILVVWLGPPVVTILIAFWIIRWLAPVAS